MSTTILQHNPTFEQPTMRAAIEYLDCLLDHYEYTGYFRPIKVRTVGAALEFENWEEPYLESLCNSMRDRYSKEQLLEAREFVLPRTAQDDIDWDAIEQLVRLAS